MSQKFIQDKSFVEWRNGKLWTEFINGEYTIKNGVSFVKTDKEEGKNIFELKNMLDNECIKEYPVLDKIMDILNNKIVPDNNSMNNLLVKWIKKYQNIQNHYSLELRELIANLFVKYGYSIEKNDVINLAKIGGEFNLIPENILNDKVLLKKLDTLFSTTGLYLYYKYFPINVLKSYLWKNYYNSYDITLLTKIFAENNIIFDIEILKLFCSFDVDSKIINHFCKKFKIEPTLECLLSCHKLPNTANFLIKKMIKIKKSN